MHAWLLMALLACDGSGEKVGGSDPDVESPAGEGVLTSEPEAAVFVKGKRVGETPYEGKPGTKVELRADLYAPKRVTLGESQTVKLKKGCAQLLGYEGMFANDPLLKPAEVAVLDDVALSRNEIFARYGRAFSTERYKKHFGSQKWYVENPNYDEDVLSKNDAANVDLMRSFEGPEAPAYERILGRTEYSAPGNRRLVFPDKKTAQVLTSKDMYEWETKEFRWAVRGEWVITWAGPSKFDPSDSKVKNARVWKLDHGKGRVLESFKLGGKRG